MTFCEGLGGAVSGFQLDEHHSWCAFHQEVLKLKSLGGMWGIRVRPGQLYLCGKLWACTGKDAHGFLCASLARAAGFRHGRRCLKENVVW